MNSVTRFSSRVENYFKYRPGYPPGILEILQSDCDLTEDALIADVGSGTGLLTKLFLENGNTVFGIEPNQLMRTMGESVLKSFSNFKSIAATAEDTTLPDNSVDFITAGQAFHWFDRKAAKQEFKRILKPSGWVILIWNARRVDSTPFLREYEALLINHSADYSEVRHENAEQQLSDFFAPNPMKVASVDNVQHLDFESLKGRLLSSSYAPEPGHPNFAKMLLELRRIFDSHQDNGIVNFEYDTRTYFGRLGD